MITSALPYANGPIHLGHIAGAYLPADIHVRHLRSTGEDVLWICGSDEHGAAITLRAKKEGTTPREIVDLYHEEMQKAFTGLDISFDHYSRTSSPKHHQVAQEFFLTLMEKGGFEVKTEEQFFDEEAQQFLADRYIQGTCPSCGHDGAYGDQCEKCGKTLSPTELVNPKSTLSGSTPVLKPTTLWYLPMGRHESWLREYIVEGKLDGQPHHDPKTWKAHVLGQCRSWIEGGLESRAMTRDLDWGVPVPVEGAEGKVLYVWLDAPIGYITATMEWCEAHGQDWKDWWQDPNAELLHFIGKDNIVFHCIIFPILLKEHGGYNLPTNVPANEFMNLEGDKISTSRNWAVWVTEYLEDFPEGSDAMRYVLTAIMPEQKDSEFTWSDFRDKVNNELADVLGNFVNRVLVLTKKYYGGEVPAAPAPKDLTDTDQALLEALAAAPDKIGGLIQRHRYKEAQLEAMNVARLGNKYLTEQEPWKLQKTDPERTATIMHLTCQVVGNCAVLLEPFLPQTAAKLAAAFGLTERTLGRRPAGHGSGGNHPGRTAHFVCQNRRRHRGRPGRQAWPKGGRHNPRDHACKRRNHLRRLHQTRPSGRHSSGMRKGAQSRQAVEVDGRHRPRHTHGGERHRGTFHPEEVVGRQVTLLVNLAPRKLRGIESQGMVLMASTEDGGLRFVSPEEGVQPGDVIS